MSESILKTQLSLRRNFADQPFLSTMQDADKALVAERVRQYLHDLPETWVQHDLRQMSAEDWEALKEQGFLDDSSKQLKDAVLFIREDKPMAAFVNFDDQMMLTRWCEVEGWESAASELTRMMLSLHERWPLAHNERLGWMTVRPLHAGTGMQASMVLHLPMLSMMQQVKGLAAQYSDKQEFLLVPLPGQPDKNPAALYLLCNSFTAYDSPQRLLESVRRAAGELLAREENLRTKILVRSTRSTYVDQVYRALGILRYARRLTEQEFLGLWSKLRLGILSGLIELPLAKADKLLEITGRTALTSMLPEGRDEHLAHFVRADLVRAELNGGT